MEDYEIIQKVLNGYSEFYEEILNKYQAKIMVYCLKMLNYQVQDSEDITSEVFVKAYLNLADYNPNFKFSSWLYRIAHNEAVNFIKKNSKIWTLELRDFLEIPIDDKTENIFKKEAIEKILNKLKPEDREILILFYLQELSLKEIGDILKLTTNTVAKKLSRSRLKAKEIIKNNNYKI